MVTCHPCRHPLHQLAFHTSLLPPPPRHTAESLHLDTLAATCHTQLAVLPLSLLPEHPGYLPRWLALADHRDLPELRHRCLSLLAGVGAQVRLKRDVACPCWPGWGHR